jgi:hypothetical protein
VHQIAAWAKQYQFAGLEIGRIGDKPVHALANPSDAAELKSALVENHLVSCL